MRFGDCGGEGRIHGRVRPMRRRQAPVPIEPTEWPPSPELVRRALETMCDPEPGKTDMSGFELAVVEVMVESTKERSVLEVTEELAEHYDRPPTRQDVMRVSARRRRRREGVEK
jgi:hypothetical protein